MKQKIKILISTACLLISVTVFALYAQKIISNQEETPALSQDDININAKEIFTPVYEKEIPEIDSSVQQKFQELLDAPKPLVIADKKNSLSDYLTEYNTSKKISVRPSSVSPEEETENEIADSYKNIKLKITDYGPQQNLPASVRQPSFYVAFSKPIVALQSLSEPSDKCEYMTVEPKVKGVFRWYGTDMLSFEAQENIDPRQKYTITVPQGIKAIDGSTLEKAFSFTTISDPLAILSAQAGFNYRKEHYLPWGKTDLPPDALKEIRIRFNYPVKAEEVKKLIKVTIANVETDFSSQQFDENTVDIFLRGIILFETKVKVSVIDSKSSVQFSSLEKFKLVKVQAYESATKSFPISINFSHRVDPETVLYNIRTVPELQIEKENIEVSGSTVTLFNLPVNCGDRISISVNENIKDIYGRNLNKKYVQSVKIPDIQSMAAFPEGDGAKILEASLPHKFAISYQNLLPDSIYKLSKENNPLHYKQIELRPKEKAVKVMKTEPKNKLIYEEVVLDPFLQDGYGSVLFNANAKIKSFRNKESSSYNYSRCFSIQVTDFAANVRAAKNKAVVLVSSMKSGKAVAGAKVFLYDYVLYTPDQIIAEPTKAVAFALSDESGLAVLYPKKNSDFNILDSKNAAFLIAKGLDKMTFAASDKFAWRTHYSSDLISSAYSSTQKTYMFTDRGIYKPGESLTFRGIDKDQKLGTLTSYTGKYQITLEHAWQHNKVYGKLEGSTSSTGGFSGSFILPDDLPPDQYKIVYKRDGNSSVEQCNFTVAFFEKLKFQASISIPEEKLVAGDTINANLSASYLAGGSLAESPYQLYWSKTASGFRTENPDFKDYKFLFDEYDYENLDNQTGLLGSNGSAKISLKTTSDTKFPLPYEYTVHANVTDVSNQLISCSATKLVHPADFYIGLAKPAGLSGYPKAKKLYSFRYKLCGLDGNAFTLSQAAKAKVELIRSEWLLEDNYRYTKKDITESTQEINLASSGTFDIKTEKAGYYKIRISAKDKKNRDVITEYTFFASGSGAFFWWDNNQNEINLTPDKNLYAPGDTAEILMETMLPQGKYLITVEREGIFTEEVLDFSEPVNVIKIPVAKNYVPVVYVSVSSYSVRKENTNEDRPKAFYGSTTLFIDSRVKSFSVKIDADKKSYLPGEKVTLKLNATKGGKAVKDAEITLLAADRAVLDLINYHIPDPTEFFYNPYTYLQRTKGFNSFDKLMDLSILEEKALKEEPLMMTKAMASRAFAASNDAMYEVAEESMADGSQKEAGSISVRSNFNPLAYFEPCIKTDSNGFAEVSFTLPDNLTRYRITAVGLSEELFSISEDELLVQNPLNVQSVLPRRMRERDTSEAGLLLTNLGNTDVSVLVKAAVTNPSSEELLSADGRKYLSGKAIIDGLTEQTLVLKPKQNASVYFNIAARKEGKINTEFTIISDVLKEKLISPLIIEKPYVYETVTTTGTLLRNETKKAEGISIPSFAKDAKGNISVTLDATRLGLLGSSVNYLFRYPYGCLEQQSSKLLPLVIFDEYIDVFGLDSEVQDVRKVALSFFNEWKKSQMSSGAFPYWPDSPYESLYVSLRIAHVAGSALKRGYTENELGFNLDKLLKYISQNLAKEKIDNYCKAYGYYVLALCGKNISANDVMQLAFKENPEYITTALCGLTFIEKGDKSHATECAALLRKFIRPTTRGVDISSFTPAGWYIYGNATEKLALSLQLFVQLNPEDDLCTRLLHSLLENQKNGYWTSTAVTARVLDAIYTLIKCRKLEDTNFTAKALLNKKEIAEKTFTGLGAKPITEKIDFTDDRISAAAKDKVLPLEFTKEGSGSLYYTTSLTYAIPDEMQSARDEGIAVSLIIKDVESGEIVEAEENTSLLKLESGKIYKAEIKLISTRDRNYLALRSPVPSGCEIIDTTFVTAAYVDDTDEFESPDIFYKGLPAYFFRYRMDNQRIYDNEVQSFYNYFPKGVTTIDFNFRAVRRGVFPLPPVTAECMYEPEVFGRSDGYLCVVE